MSGIPRVLVRGWLSYVTKLFVIEMPVARFSRSVTNNLTIFHQPRCLVQEFLRKNCSQPERCEFSWMVDMAQGSDEVDLMS